MLRWKSESLLMWVSPAKTAFYRTEKNRTELFAEVLKPENASLTQHIAQCLQHLPKHRSALQIILDDSLAKFWQVNPPLNTTQFNDIQAVAGLRFEALYDQSANDWLIDADWNARDRFLACAVPTNLIQTISQALNTQEYRHIKIIGCTPVFVYYWNLHKDQLTDTVEGLGVVGTRSMTVALIHNSNLQEVRCLPLSDLQPETLQELDRSIQNLAVQLELQAPKKIYLTGDLPQHWNMTTTRQIEWQRLGPAVLTKSTIKPLPERAA